MNRRIVSTGLILLVGLALSFTQAFAAGPGLPAEKKTPEAGQPGTRAKVTERSAEKNAEKEQKREEKQAGKPEKPGKPVKTEKSPRPEKTVRSELGKSVNFRGTIAGISADTLDLNLKNGGSQSIDLSGDPEIHIPTMGSAGSAGDLKPGMQVSVHAVQPPKGGDPLAISINVIPGEPQHSHHYGLVTGYTEGESITVRGMDGQLVTYTIADAKILPKAGMEIIVGETIVTVVCPHGVKGGDLVAQAIVVHQGPEK